VLIDDLRRVAGERPVPVVVDNRSLDGTVELVGAHPDIILVEPGRNFGYAGGINAGSSLGSVTRC
jgi:GT2 family glycosyltransferase